MELPPVSWGLRQKTRRPESRGRVSTEEGAEGTMSDHTGSPRLAGSEAPTAFTATTLMFTRLPGPLPGVGTVQVVEAHAVVAIVPPEGFEVVTSKRVISELLNAPGSKPIVTDRSPNPVARTFVTDSGRSCTEIRTVPHAARSASRVASCTWYWNTTSWGSASAATSTESRERSPLGVIRTPEGSEAESMPRTELTMSGVDGNGLPA